MDGLATAGSVRMLVVSPTWLGDAVMALPAVKSLRREYAQAQLCVLSKPQLVEFWTLTGLTDRVFVQQSGTGGTLTTAHELRAASIDHAYIIPNSFRSALIVRIAGIPERIGFRGHYRSALLTDIREHSQQYGIHQSAEVMSLLGDDSRASIDSDGPLIKIETRGVEAVRKRFGLTDKTVAIIPGAARGPSKCWPEDRYAALGRMLADSGRFVIVLGTGAERDLCAKVAASAGGGARSLAGETSLVDLAFLLKACDALVANDSGGMHLAAAVGTPVVAVYGITDPQRTGPLGSECVILQNSEFRARDVPRDSLLARKCLESITIEAVYKAVENLIYKSGSGE